MRARYLGTGVGCSEPVGDRQIMLAVKTMEFDGYMDMLPLLFCREAAKVFPFFPAKFTVERIVQSIMSECKHIPAQDIKDAPFTAEVYLVLEWFFDF